MGTITATRGYLEDPYLLYGYLGESVDFTEFNQVNMVINNTVNATSSQVDRLVDNFQDSRNSEVKNTNPFIHAVCVGYLESGGYLEDPYLVGSYCVSARSQVDMNINNFPDVRSSQVDMQINDFPNVFNSQVNMIINDFPNASNSEVLQVIIQALNSQVILSIYNIIRPRIMCEFPSRGNDGLNWTASSTEPGDFSINNVNNDIEEFIWRSATGIISGITLTCDVQSGPIFMDTFYLANHNFTSSANVVLQGSTNPGFGPVGFEETLTVGLDPNRIFYIAPALPTNGFRYWRLLISDVTNTASFLQTGLIVFGSSRIMNTECTTDNIIVNFNHFKNAVKTEGFTSVSNDRALKRAMTMNFRDLSFSSGDFTLLDDVLQFARTSLKCLWIVDPSNNSLIRRFHAFGKVKKMPAQRHKVRGKTEGLDFIDLTVEVDESE